MVRSRHGSATIVGAISSRNALIHGYDEIDDEVVWDTVTVDLPTLRTEVDTLLRELDDGTP